jgi:hypothetical protein
MDETYNFEEIEIQLNENTVAYVEGHLDYEANWSNGDYDDEFGTVRVGMEFDDLTIEHVWIDSFHTMTKIKDTWVEVGGVEDESNIDKDLLPILEKLVEQSSALMEELVRAAQEHEYDYSP